MAEGVLARGFSSGNHSASLFTTLTIGARSAATKVARAVGSFAQAVKNAMKKLGPWAVPLANFLYSVLKASAAALSWLASKLWVLAIAMGASLVLVRL